MADRDDIPKAPPAARAKKPVSGAGGYGAIWSTLGHLRDGVGARKGLKILQHMNKPDGFDCPGCAWPEPEHRAKYEFCENGAKAFAEETSSRLASPDVVGSYSLRELQGKTEYELGRLGRLTQPLISLAGAPYQLASWKRAYEVIAAEMTKLDDPNQAVFYTSGRTSNEAAFLYQLLGRRWGTNNFPDCSNMCHESTGVGLMQTVGVGKGTVSLDDFALADAIFVFGQNPGTNHPRMLSTLREAARRGAKIVSVNPLRESGLVKFRHPQKLRDMLVGGVKLASEFVQLRTGSDIAFLKGMMKQLVEWHEQSQDVLHTRFIADHTDGFDALKNSLADVSWSDIVERTGLEREQIVRCADIYRRAKSSIACWAMGITQHVHGVANVREIVNLMLMRGNLGRPGAGLCPVRGHSNVQGDRTMGIDHKPSEAFLTALEARYDFRAPRQHGYDTIACIEAMAAGDVRAFFAMGGNFLSAAPDTDKVAEGLASLDLTVSVATKLNRSHTFPGKVGLILPCLGRSEIDRQASGPQFVTVENSMSIVHSSRGVRSRLSPEQRSEPEIIAGFARALLDLDWSHYVADYERIRDDIAAVIPGFKGFRERIRIPHGFVLPNLAGQRDFRACGGAAHFTVNALPTSPRTPNAFVLMTIRSHDQYNTTIYGQNDRYRGIRGGRDVVFISKSDLDRLGVPAGTRVEVSSHYDDMKRLVRGFQLVPYDIPRGCLAMYFPEANPLVPLSHHDVESGTPASKSIEVRLTPLVDMQATS